MSEIRWHIAVFFYDRTGYCAGEEYEREEKPASKDLHYRRRELGMGGKLFCGGDQLLRILRNLKETSPLRIFLDDVVSLL